jgi:hypothetical protein
VLYILPWQPPEEASTSFDQFQPDLEKLIRPINREEFLNEFEQ